MNNMRVSQSDGIPDAVRDAAWVIVRLEEAGGALLALPQTGYTTRLRMAPVDIVRTAFEGTADADRRIRPPVPSAAQITRMDEAFGWLALIPLDRHVLRRIVGARALVNPTTDRHLFSWRRLGRVVGADHKAVQRWHAQGIDMIVAALSPRVVAIQAGGRRATSAVQRGVA